MSDDTHDFDPKTGAYAKPDNAEPPVPADSGSDNGDGDNGDGSGEGE